jgi:hypothetical protein
MTLYHCRLINFTNAIHCLFLVFACLEVIQGEGSLQRSDRLSRDSTRLTSTTGRGHLCLLPNSSSYHSAVVLYLRRRMLESLRSLLHHCHRRH